MTKSITRAEAIETIARNDLAGLSDEERAEQLFCMASTDWEDSPAWATLPPDLQAELVPLTEFPNASDERYDQVLMIWLRGRQAADTNEFLLTRIRELRPEIEEIDGAPDSAEPCPCCGRCTLEARSQYEICPVCWWEDDGQDNQEASINFGGPNRVSLTLGRLNFLKHGIYDPRREDLRTRQHPPTRYRRGRRFELSAAGDTINEPAAGWSASASIEE